VSRLLPYRRVLPSSAKGGLTEASRKAVRLAVLVPGFTADTVQ
jgi:hypothetical protein